MTIQEFKQNFCFRVKIQNPDNKNLTIITEAVRKKDNVVVDGVKTTIDIQETRLWINDSQSSFSIIPWSWEKLIDQTKRFQLDYFAQRAPIEDWYPLDKQTNSDISDLYCEID